MNAKFILAAIAAVCCVQGIAAASVARPLPASEEDVTVIDLSNLDIDDVLEQLMLTIEQASHDDDVRAVEVAGDKKLKAPRNIVSCLFSIVGLIKTGKSAWDLFEESQSAKRALKEAEKKCAAVSFFTVFDKTPITNDKEACVQEAKAAYETESKKVHDQIIPEVIKVVSSVWSIKACFSLI